MKNLMMIAIVLVSLCTTAQTQKRDRGDRMEMRKDISPEEKAQLQSKKMTLKLDLTNQQQAEVEQIILQDAKIRQTKKEEFKTLKANKDGGKMSKEDRLAMANNRLDAQIEMKKKMKAILSADQYSKFESLQNKTRHRRGEKSNVKRQRN